MQPTLSVSQLVTLVNETFDLSYPALSIEGEVAGFKPWNNRLAFFDLKDEAATVNCMIPLVRLESPVEDGMRVKIIATPKLTKKGRFSLSVVRLEPVGEGALKRSFELLLRKLETEGLFEASRKRSLPTYPSRVGVITSLESAAYQDFLKIINARWAGLEIVAVHSQVQGEAAPAQIVAGIEYFNHLADPVEVVAVIRGGGSLEDLAAFNSESVVRAVAASRTPVIVGVGHETDTSLADLAADVRAATPTDAARLLTLDKAELLQRLNTLSRQLQRLLLEQVEDQHQQVAQLQTALYTGIDELIERSRREITSLARALSSYDPQAILTRGYALVRKRSGGVITSARQVKAGDRLMIQLSQDSIEAEVVDGEAETRL